MNQVEPLHRKLDALLTEASRIRSEGECLQGMRLKKAAAGGTASIKSQQTYKYARLRCGKGKALAGGAKSRYVEIADIPAKEAAIARGQELTKIEKAITKLQAKISLLELVGRRSTQQE